MNAKQQHKQKRKKRAGNNISIAVIAVLILLGIRSVVLYRVEHGFHFYDFHLRWQECAYLLKGIDPLAIYSGRVAPDPTLGLFGASGGTVPWAYVLDQILMPGFLPYETARIYGLILNTVLPVLAWCFLFRWLEREGYVTSRLYAALVSLLVFAPVEWAYAVGFGNQSGILACLVIIGMCLLDSHPVWAGVVLAIAMVKPQITFVFFLPLLLRKRWKTIFTSVGIVFVCWGAASLMTHVSPLTLALEMLDQGLSYSNQYFGLFNFLLSFGASTGMVLLLDMAAGFAVFALAAFGIFYMGESDNWLLWFSVMSIISVFWFYKQSHDYIVLMIAAVCALCDADVSVVDYGLAFIYCNDMIGAVAYHLLVGMNIVSNASFYTWSKLGETLVLIASIGWLIARAKRNSPTFIRQNYSAPPSARRRSVFS